MAIKPCWWPVDNELVLKPTLAEEARTELSNAGFGNLAVLDSTHRPMVTNVPLVDDGAGNPVTVISNLAAITARAHRDPRAGINIGGRLMIQGNLEPVPGIQQIEIQNQFIARHVTLVRQVESLDFSWFRLAATSVCWTDDNGDEKWLEPADISGAEPDPFGHYTQTEVSELAERIGDDLIVMVRGLSGIHRAKTAELFDVDRYGLVVTITEPGTRRRTRVPFPERLNQAGEIHAAIGALAQAARNTPSAAEASLETPATFRTEIPVEIRPKKAVSRPSTLLESIEGYSGGGADVDGIDSA